jgi:Acyl-coenzyme A:6-aminopenicillanic acid acyl-transferase
MATPWQQPLQHEAIAAQGASRGFPNPFAPPFHQPVVRLGGTPFAMGHQHGTILGPGIRQLEQVCLTFLGQLYGGGTIGWLRARSAHLVMRLLAGASVLRYWPSAFRAELKGIVAGMQASGDGRFDLTRLAVINAFDDLAGAWTHRSLACSAFAIRGRGGMIVGRNLDYAVLPRQLAALNTTFIFQPQGRIPFVSWGWPGYIGVVTGVNAQRLSLSLLTSPTRDASMRGTPEGLVNRLLLEDATTPHEAFDRLGALRRTVGNNLLLATPDEAHVIESSRSQTKIRAVASDRLVVTNHYHLPEMVTLQANFAPWPQSPLDHPFLSLEGSQQRASDIAALLHVGMTVEQAMQVLQQPSLVSGGQVQSVVMDLAQGEVWVAQGPAVPVCSSGYQPSVLANLFADG